ncbi:pyocin knob domain-containing protein [Inediibacterium massiliense]|uniref:pyocin knob domain-containing protein n=1 Tax=Inediibacterium massiliense TaxID=1658111 RepID=UPI0006B585F7|nr:pyocin knob domain-containing protein [Inediibacterium massiliense]
MAENKIRIEDHNGNVYYPQTKSDVVFMKNGRTVEDAIIMHQGENKQLKEKLNGVDKQLNGIATYFETDTINPIYRFSNDYDDPNNTTRSFIVTKHANSPVPNSFCYIVTLTRDKGNKFGTKKQTAFVYGTSDIFIRYGRTNPQWGGNYSWSSWKRILTQDDYDQLFQSASNGKTEIATAITGMGQNASGSEVFSVLANKIKDISKDATARANDVLNGKTFYQGGKKQTGVMPNHNAFTINPTTFNQIIPKGYHNGSGIVKGESNLRPENIKQGVNIFGINGNFIGGVELKNIQSGSTYVYRSRVTVPISSVDLSKSFIIISGKRDKSPYLGIGINVKLYHNKLELEGTQAGNALVGWSVLEFKRGISVQHGRSSHGKVNISPINIERSFIPPIQFDMAYKFNSNTQIEMIKSTDRYPDGNDFDWQVVSLI